MNPWTPAYKDKHPIGIIVAPTHKIMRQSTLQEFDEVFPREAILHRRGPPHSDITLINGFRFLLHSGEGEIEGITACLVWVDEIHHNTFASRAKRFMNLLARLRDKHSQRMAMIVSGLPEPGFVRDTFEHETENRRTILAATTDNPHIPQETLNEYYASCPSGQERALLGGHWMAPPSAIYPQYEAGVHLVDREMDPRLPVHLSFDIGNFGCVMVGQTEDIETKDVIGRTNKELGLLIGDQLLTENEGIEAMGYRIKTQTPWIVRPGASIITTDPTTRRDEHYAMKKHFPGVRIVQRKRGHEHFPVEAGIEFMQRGFMDALGNVRLRISKKISKMPLGLVDGLTRYRRSEITGQPVKDNLRDHPLDATRYLVAFHLPPRRAKHGMIGE